MILIYLDYNSTTPVAPEVLESMLPYFKTDFGNAHSAMHSYGWKASAAVDQARNQVAKLLNCQDSEIIFNSGATEGINTAIRGLFHKFKQYKNHIITTKSEHVAVYESCKILESQGARVTYLDIDENGLINLDQLSSAIEEETFLVCIMLVNNETGVIQDFKSISHICQQKGVILMSDTTQAIGKIPVDVQALGIDIAVISAHKIYGPKGVGAIYLRRKKPRVSLIPQITGGVQEDGKRAGTLNVPGIVGLAKACELLQDWNQESILELKQKLEIALIALGGKINGSIEQRVSNTINVSFKQNASTTLQSIKHKVAVSLGSACSSGSGKPSRVLTYMGFDANRVNGSIRISLGKYTTEAEIDQTIKIFQNALIADVS